jgi:hypothetical protein
LLDQASAQRSHRVRRCCRNANPRPIEFDTKLGSPFDAVRQYMIELFNSSSFDAFLIGLCATFIVALLRP